MSDWGLWCTEASVPVYPHIHTYRYFVLSSLQPAFSAPTIENKKQAALCFSFRRSVGKGLFLLTTHCWYTCVSSVFLHPWVFVCDGNWMYSYKSVWLIFPHDWSEEQAAQGKLWLGWLHCDKHTLKHTCTHTQHCTCCGFATVQDLLWGLLDWRSRYSTGPFGWLPINMTLTWKKTLT